MPSAKAAVNAPAGVSDAVVTVFIDRPNHSANLFSRLLAPNGRRIAGSGTIVSPDGLVVTSTHVVTGGVHPMVRLLGGREFNARILLADDRSDIAVLQMVSAADSLPNLAFAQSGLHLGEAVTALGSPNGGDQQARAGTVKALALTAPGIADFPPFIETDAALSPGFSGGPLIDAARQIVGVDTAIYSRQGRFEGSSFAVPASTAMRILARARAALTPYPADGAMTSEPVLLSGRQPLGGATVTDVQPRSAHDYAIDPATVGVVVTDPGHGYAEEAGFETGDVVVSVNGHPATSAAALETLLSAAEGWSIEVLRGSRRLIQTFNL